VHHAERWAFQRRGEHPYERFIPMPNREAYERRVQLATRQSGRGMYRRHLIQDIRCKHDVELPPPPPIRLVYVSYRKYRV